MNQSAVQSTVAAVYKNFNVAIKVISEIEGPSTTLIEIVPVGQTKVKYVLAMEEELAIALKAISVRCTLMSNRGTIGVEITTGRQSTVPFQYEKQPDMELPVFVGLDTTGTPVYKDLTKCPHTLIAGATGAGKSCFINSLIASILNCPNSPVKFVMIDPKKVELSMFNDLGPDWFFSNDSDMAKGPITETIDAVFALSQLCKEMDDRYKKLKDMKARNLVEAREKGLIMPYIVCVIDEFADLMMTNGKMAEAHVIRLAQLARAVGIHVVIATQRPSVNVITGLIKANFPVRVAFKVASKVDSRIVLDQSGAQALCGKGDMLWKGGLDLERIQGCFISTDEVEQIVREKAFEKSQETVLEVVEEEIVQEPINEESEIVCLAKEAIRHLKEYCDYNRIAFRVHLNLIMRKMKVDYAQACEIATEVRSITGI